MAPPRFVLRYRGPGAPPGADIARVHEFDGLVVVTATPTMVLVESEPQPLRELLATLPGWFMAPEQQYGVPDERLDIAGPPG